MKVRSSALLFLISIIIGCVPAPTSAPVFTPTLEPTSETDSANWWRDAIFYEIFVRSYYDSDGNGIGDFNGIIQKLDYIQSLGVTALWLMPIHPSPSYHGYDVIDYYNVNPDYGTLEDLRNLLAEAHQRNIRIITDLVINHTSSEHPFFIEANSDVNSPRRDWYVWSDQPGLHWHQGNRGYYYGLFCDCMPDINYRTQAATAEIYEVTRFWLEDLGVDGFRLDATKHLIEEGDILEGTKATHEWLKEYYTFYKSVDEDAYSLGEVYGAGAFLATAYSGELDHIFNFELASGFIESLNGQSNRAINSAWESTLENISNGEYATFLTNHDQNRLMSALSGRHEKARLAAVMLLTSPGTPFIYYGEEIGMQGIKPDENIRLPMQWNAQTNAGFTTGTPWRAVDPGYVDVNTAAQDGDPDSILNLYRRLTGLRADHSSLRTGSLAVLETDNPGLYAILRYNEEEAVLVLINLTRSTVSDYALTLNEAVLNNGSSIPSSLLDSTSALPLDVIDEAFEGYQPLAKLSPYHAYIFQIK